MKAQKFKVLTLVIFLINVIFAHGMKENDYVASAVATYNNTHPLICLLPEVQKQIIFSGYTNDTNIEKENMDELKEIVKTFFVCTYVCKYFNKNLKLPWADLERVKKNNMLEKIISCIPLIVYKKYQIVPLALVYSGADADTKPTNWNTSLYNAVCNQDELAIAMLLSYKADPYQLGLCKNPICFGSTTLAIAKLFGEKIDKNELLSKFADASWELLDGRYSPEIMTFWLDYGVNPRYLDKQNNSIFHELGHSIYWSGNTINNILAKGELLLKCIPDMVNMISGEGATPIDTVENLMRLNRIKMDWHSQIIALFRKYNGKTAQELAIENAQ